MKTSVATICSCLLVVGQLGQLGLLGLLGLLVVGQLGHTAEPRETLRNNGALSGNIFGNYTSAPYDVNKLNLLVNDNVDCKNASDPVSINVKNAASIANTSIVKNLRGCVKILIPGWFDCVTRTRWRVRTTRRWLPLSGT